MNNLPKISIITPSFNQGQYIEQTILSVLDQGYPNLEYIVIDGGSTDNTVDIIKKYSERIAYWLTEPDSGQTEAINKGFARATGEIINWLNSDDYYAPGTFANLAATFRDPAIKAVTTTVHNFEEGGAEWDETTSMLDTNIDYIARSFNNQPGTFFLREIWSKYFPLPQQLRYTMDQYLWFCFWLEHDNIDFKFETYTTAFFRRHSGSKTSGSLTDAIFNHLGKVFFNEHNLIFWSFFSQNAPYKAAIIAAYFCEDYDFPAHKITFPATLKSSEDQTEKIFQYYLFTLLKEDFSKGFFSRLKSNITCLHPYHFTPAERRHIRRMKWCTISPRAFKLYRRIYWKVKQSVK